MKLAGHLVFALAVTCRVAAAATLHIDDFNVLDPAFPTLGWEGGSSPTRIASGGVDGSAYLQISTTFNTHLAAKNTNARWQGDYVAIGAKRLEADLMAPASSPSLEMRLALFGPDSTDLWTSASSQVVPNDGVWRHYVFSAAEGDIVSDGAASSYTDLMADVFRVMLRYDEMADGPNPVGSANNAPSGSTLGIDNIELAASPAPPIPGDFDGDGDVDEDDLTMPPLGWAGRFGVDLQGADFLDWQRNFPTPPEVVAASQTAPEPSALAIAAAGVIPALSRRRANR